MNLFVEVDEIVLGGGLLGGEVVAQSACHLLSLLDGGDGGLDDLRERQDLLFGLLERLLQDLDLLLDGVVLLGGADVEQAFLALLERRDDLGVVTLFGRLELSDVLKLCFLMVELGDQHVEVVSILVQTILNLLLLRRDLIELEIDVLEFTE